MQLATYCVPCCLPGTRHIRRCQFAMAMLCSIGRFGPMHPKMSPPSQNLIILEIELVQVKKGTGSSRESVTINQLSLSVLYHSLYCVFYNN